MMQLQKKIFEGKIFRELLKKNKNNLLFYKELNLNKTWLSDIIPDYIENTKFTYTENIKKFIKLMIKIFFYEYVLVKKNNGNHKIWIVVSNSIRKTHYNFIKSEEKSSLRPSIISWQKKFKIKSISNIVNQIKYYNLCINSLKKISKNLDYMDIAYKALVSIDLYDSPMLAKPRAILSLKDFQRHENAIIQKANTLKIPTFTTQLVVYPNFTDKNERGGACLHNAEAKNILLWGSLLKSVYLIYHNDKLFHLSKNFFLPKSKKINLNKKGILFCLGGMRHLFEISEMLNLVTKDKRYYKNNFKIFIKLHPAISETFFDKFFKKLLEGLDYKILVSKNKSNIIGVNKNLIAITGLSGSYYDCIYLGIKTLFFDYDYKISNTLPRVTFNVNKDSNLRECLHKIEKISNIQWKKKSDLVLKKAWGLTVGKKNSTKLSDQIARIIKIKK